MQEFLNRSYFGNTILHYLTFLIVFLFGILIIYILKKIVLNRIKLWTEKTNTTLELPLVKGIQKLVIPFLYYIAFYSAFKTLRLDRDFIHAFDVISTIILTFLIIKLIIASLQYFFSTYLNRQEGGAEKFKQLKGISSLISVLVWVIGSVFLLDNLGFKVSAVVTGLGIGGIAIALASQAVLKDLFSYLVIFFDRPFEIGDSITVGDKTGTVERIGIKTTRLRGLGGEQLIFSNTDLTDSRIHNYKRMEKRRVVLSLGVTYQTSLEELKEIPAIVKRIIKAQPEVTFDRGHFTTLGDSSLNFEVVYYVNSSDYTKFMDAQQAINLKIFDEFNTRKIEFAYPTQTLFLSKD